MPSERDNDVPTDTTREAEAMGVQKHAHGNVDQWRQHNVEDEERGPVDQTGDREQEDQAVDAPESGERGEDNLVQLPVGVKFDLDHEPSPQEQEELVRFAGEADRELHDQNGQDAQDTGE